MLSVMLALPVGVHNGTSVFEIIYEFFNGFFCGRWTQNMIAFFVVLVSLKDFRR